MVGRPTALICTALVVLLIGCTPSTDPSVRPTPSSVETQPDAPASAAPGPAYVAERPPDRTPVIRDGSDWSMPAWARPAPFSGFFSESDSPTDGIAVRSIDVSWRQIAPTEGGELDLSATGEAQGMFFDPLGAQLAEPGPYWLRMFSSGADWAPEWVIEKCGAHPIGTDYDGQQHLPLWDDCVWDALSATWRQLLVDQGVLGDPDFQFAYVPGGFTWSEFDYEMVNSAVRRGELSRADYLRWFDRMIADFVTMAGPEVGRLVFTGEDYPWGPFGAADDLLASHAVDGGLGVRTGITEVFNFHLSETPAYGSRVLPDGHLANSGRNRGPNQVFGTENECYVDCGFSSRNPIYVVEQSNLKALQLQVNWMYVVPGDSLLDPAAQHWDWVRLSLGQRPETAPDAWAALRDAEDVFWRDPGMTFGARRLWPGRPYVRNLERWLVQVDAPGARPRRSLVDIHRGDPVKDNGVAFEGLSTDLRRGQRSLAFRVDQRFLDGDRAHEVLVKVTFLDRGRGNFRLRLSRGVSEEARLTGSDTWRTATFRVRLRPDHSLPQRTDVWLDVVGESDLNVRFVRVIRLARPG